MLSGVFGNSAVSFDYANSKDNEALFEFVSSDLGIVLDWFHFL